MKRTFYYAGIGIALFFLVLELTYINAKSLLYLVSESGLIDRVFAVIGSLAFSVVTVLVMRTSSIKWMRVVFPCFDALLVFSGFNLKYADNLLGNPVAFYLTIFLAVFTGLIMYSLGSIGSRLAGEKLQHAAEKLQPASMQEHSEKKTMHGLQVIAEHKKTTQVYRCSVCGREFATNASRRSHEGHCRKNNVKKIAL